MSNNIPAAVPRFRLIAKTFMGCLAVILGLGGMAFFTRPKLREWFYRETSYRIVLDFILSSLPDSEPETITKAVANYVHQQVYQGGGAVMDTDPWTHLVRGIGWCDQKAWTIATLLALKGIPGRLVMLRDEEGVSPHTVLEVFLDRKWRFLDPSFNFMFHSEDGSWGTLSDFPQDPNSLLKEPLFCVLEPIAQEEILEAYRRVLPTRMAPAIWRSVAEARQAQPSRVLGERIVDLLWKTFGKTWAYSLQDLYLSLLPLTPPPEDRRFFLDVQRGYSFRQLSEAKRFYYQGRNYHLYQRFRNAELIYLKLVREYPETSYAERGQFWLGQLALRQGKERKAVQSFLDFVAFCPKSAWLNRAYDRLAYVYGRLGQPRRAAVFERYALTDPLVPTASRISQRIARSN